MIYSAGRRGVFDGIVENMHLHWKHRELVKILVKELDDMEVQETARMLEYESGGILVAVTPTNKGQAIIMYRGKNYQRPTELRPRNLLTKRKALKRSLELQRHEVCTDSDSFDEEGRQILLLSISFLFINSTYKPSRHGMRVVAVQKLIR